MLSIGKFAKESKVSTRTLRHYESLGLIEVKSRGENGYRYFSSDELKTVSRIKKLRELGFSLSEIKKILEDNRLDQFSIQLKKKVQESSVELDKISHQHQSLKAMHSIYQRFSDSQYIDLNERKVLMNAVSNFATDGIKMRAGRVTPKHTDYISREKNIFSSDDKEQFIEALWDCLRFAKERGLTLGPGRGYSASSILLYGLGYGQLDPVELGLIPERFGEQPVDIHMDVEFSRGQEFVDYCEQKTKSLKWGKITAFKMPLLDIINNVHAELGEELNYSEISDDDPLVLDNIRAGEIDQIFLLDYSPDALVMKFENHFHDYVGSKKIKQFLKSQKIHTFQDVLNIIALWRPNHQEKIDRFHAYKKAKEDGFCYDFLDDSLIEILEGNFGRVIYHEEIIQIIGFYSGWNLKRANSLRRSIQFNRPSDDLREFKKVAPKKVFDLVNEEAKWSFCKAHTGFIWASD